ncbi:uncharacterized protein LOC143188389 isoform X2 [Calliopsis andreniformis]|uniref:uncharacterized protein LOC143188389 isoform X2 n=1 Tax=Calliopsis andreniformis TaxID=337506 RepID=UPI003FCDBE42
MMDDRVEESLEQLHNDSIDVLGNYVRFSESTFPWLINFNKIMCSSVGSRSFQLLERLLSLYTENILTNINTYCENAFDMTKLKNHVHNTLTFFHLYWHDIKENISDCDSYLNGMSVLLGIYIDMELKTFKYNKDSSSIATKLLSALWIYLDHSEKHIFRVLLKLKLITKKYVEICEPIFRICFNNLRRNVESLTDLDYVRYLLVLKMWKRIKENLEEKKKVNKVALMILGPRAPTMRDELSKIIPKPPIEQDNETLWLLQPNVFDLKTACNNYLAIEDATSVQYKHIFSTKISDLNNSQKSQIVSSRNIKHTQESAVKYELSGNEMCNLKTSYCTQNTSNGSDQMFSVKRRGKFKKHKKSKLKPGEIILIDLTKDDESLRIGKSKNQKRKCKRRLEWLKMMKKKFKDQKQVNNEVKCRNEVEIADAHSTENSENSVDNVCLEDLPISDNKVSESTESCTSVEQETLQDNTHSHSQILHDYICNKKNKQLKCMFQHKECDNCVLSLKQNNMQHKRVLSLLKLLNVVEQNIKEPKAILDLFRETSEQNIISSQHTPFYRNTTDETSEIDTQGKEELFSQPKSSIETILLSKECQSSIINTESIKQELPTSTNCNMMEADNCQNAVYVQGDCRLQDFRSMNSNSSQVTEAVKQEVSHNVHECASCCKKTEAKPFFCHNRVFNATKSKDMTQNAIDDNSIDKKSICDKNIICMLSDLDKCMGVLNRIGEHIMTVHAEKQRLECSDKAEACAVSTTVSGDHIAEPTLGWAQSINPLTNSEKLNKILELYGKKEFLNICNMKDYYRYNEDPSMMLNMLKCESEIGRKKDLFSCGENHVTFFENKLSEDITSNHVKSKLEQSIKQENGECFDVAIDRLDDLNKHEILMTNNQAHTDEFFTYNLKNTNEEKSEDMYCESTLQNFSKKSDLTKAVDEFENIDILDSILNGDIIMEDEQEMLENSHSALMSPIDYDNSNNVLNCISEFVLQSEHTYLSENEEKYITSDIENSPTPLPEGSLGTTGILNSLLDFELTNMDSPSNDFMYSNVQAVNPRLIKKSFEKEILYKEEKLCVDENDVIDDGMNLLEFDLNTNGEETCEFPSPIKNLSSFSDQSNILVNSDNISPEMKESFPKCSLSSPVNKLSTDAVVEKSYIFRKEDSINEIQSLNNATNRASPNTCTSNVPSNRLINCTLSKQNDSPLSHKRTRMEIGTSSLPRKQSLDCNLLSSIDLMSCKTIALSQCEVLECKGSLKRRNIQKDIRRSCVGKQDYIKKHEVEINAQSKSSKRRLRCKRKTKEEKKVQEKESSIVQPNQNELSLRCSQLTVINPSNHQSSELPLSSFHMSYHQKSPHLVCTSKNMYKQLKCVGIQQLRNISQRKQQILLNIQRNSTMNTVFTEDSQMKNSEYIMEDNIMEDSKMLYEPVEKSHIPEDKDEINPIANKCVTELSNNIFVKTGTQWILQNTDTESSKFVKKQIAATDEKMPPKRKKLLPKFSSTLETNAVACSVNQQEAQKKYFGSARKVYITIKT